MSSEGGDQKISEQRNECDDSDSVVAIKVMAAHSQGWQVDASCGQEASVTMGSSPVGCLWAPLTWQLAFPGVADQRQSTAEAAMSFVT